ncbi:MBL fold metallo-hydrolase [Sphingomonas sp. CJ20]
MLVRSLSLLLLTTATPAVAQTVPNTLQLGDTRVTALDDGVFALPSEQLLVEPRKGEVAELLQKVGKPPLVPTSVNAFLIERAGHRVLIDTGSGLTLGPTLGKVGAALEAAKIAPDTIEAVLITHLHVDHAGGLLRADGSAAFPKATVWIEAGELAFWTDPANRAKVDASVAGTFDAIGKLLAPYTAAGRVKTFRAGSEVVPGVRSVALPGHTPGHEGYRISGGGQSLLAWGDVMHVADVQFPDPAITIRFDSDQAQARAARIALLQAVASKGEWIAAAHIAYPGIGQIHAMDGAYHWVPIK